MRAIVVTPGIANSVYMRDMPDPVMQPDQVAVKVIRVGLCGTDAEINAGHFGEVPAGEDVLILGHENFGVVADVGKDVRGFTPGDFVVATVRRPCHGCFNCAHGENDMCTSGRYEERGIVRRHGYLAQFYVESPVWLNKIARASANVGVLLEPTSVVEKGIEQAFALQRRLLWRPKTALVLGAGPIGLLAAAVLRLRGLATFVVAREPASDRRAQIASQMGASFISVADRSLLDVKAEMPPIDLAIEATGAAAVAFAAMQMLGRNGALCLLSVTAGRRTAEEPIEQINQQLVLQNNVVFGSVNANPRHFKAGVDDLATLQSQWPGLLDAVITDRIPWEQYGSWFGGRRDGIKYTLEVAGDESHLTRGR